MDFIHYNETVNLIIKPKKLLMQNVKEQPLCVSFCVKLAVKLHHSKALGWHSLFREGWHSLGDGTCFNCS